MGLTDGVRFFKTQKEESKKILAKYTRQNNEAYLEAAYEINAKLMDRVPYVTREGMDIQVKDAVARKPGAVLKVDDVIDDSIVAELEKEGFHRQALQAVVLAARERVELLERLERFEPVEVYFHN